MAGWRRIEALEREREGRELSKLAHEAMKRTSDFVGALIRLGLLALLIAHLFDRTSQVRDGTGYWYSLYVFVGFLSLVWLVLAIRILLFVFSAAFALMEKRLERFVQDGEQLEKSAKKHADEGLLKRLPKEIKYGLKSVTRTWVALFVLGLFLFVVIHSSIAAYFEISEFLTSR